MRVQIFSDLHREFAPFDPPSEAVDLVVLAGDIDMGVRGLKWANEAFSCPTIYVAGNHEFYKQHFDRALVKMRDAAAPHVHVLENGEVRLGQFRVLGATAWTDYSVTGDVVKAAGFCRDRMNDFRLIRAGSTYRRFSPADAIQRNTQTKDWLAQKLAEPYDGQTMVVTHHCPLVGYSGMREEEPDELLAAYSNDWTELVQQADVWIFGHTHTAIDSKEGRCRLLSNPRGYPGESCGFRDDWVIEL